jgi:hypothetical protein
VVPSALLEAPCFAFDSDISAGCQGTSLSDPDDLSLTSRGNFTGDYPPVFYFVMRVFVGDDIQFSVIAMRIANALLFVGLLSTSYLAAPAGLRRPLVIGSAVTAVPLGMFIVPSINPSSWAVLSGATFLVSLLGYLTAGSRRTRLTTGLLAGLSLAFGAGARADAAIYAALAVVVALVLTVRRERRNLALVAYPVVLAIAAAIAYLSTGQSGAAEGSGGGLSLSHLTRVLIEVPDLWVGALGKWGLGWLDTPMPALVWVTTFGIFVLALGMATRGASLRRWLAVGTVAAASWAVPAYIQYLSGAPVGAFVQPRYILPLLTLLAVTATVRLSGTAFRITPHQRWFAVLGLSGANALALFVNLRRYVTGFDDGGLNLDSGAEWWWDAPISPMGVWVLGSLAFALALVLLSAELTTSAPAAGEARETDPEVGSGNSATGLPKGAAPAP